MKTACRDRQDPGTDDRAKTGAVAQSGLVAAFSAGQSWVLARRCRPDRFPNRRQPLHVVKTDAGQNRNW